MAYVQLRLYKAFAIAVSLGAAVNCEAKAPDIKPVAGVTLEECTVKQVQVELIACFEQLNRQNDAAAEQQKLRVETKRAKNAELEQAIEYNDTTIIGLSKEAEEARQRLEDRVLEPERK